MMVGTEVLGDRRFIVWYLIAGNWTAGRHFDVLGLGYTVPLEDPTTCLPCAALGRHLDADMGCEILEFPGILKSHPVNKPSMFRASYLSRVKFQNIFTSAGS